MGYHDLPLTSVMPPEDDFKVILGDGGGLL